ncbi:MAG: hypothetical protein ACHQHN_18495, partial [Sphingobacteriales bacterium]
MAPKPDLLSKLKTSWTKYDSVQVIDIIASNEIADFINKNKKIDEPILRSFLGIKSLNEPLPLYWNEIQQYPDQIKLFSLLAVLFTHHSNIESFANEYSTGDMHGVFIVAQEGIKQYTNIRSALVESGAAEPSFRRRKNVPYDFSKLFENGNVGPLFKQVLKERLNRVGYENIDNDSEFYEISYENNFQRALSLSKEQYKKWLEGESLDNKIVIDDLKWLEQYTTLTEIKAFSVTQWLSDWDKINFDESKR